MKTNKPITMKTKHALCGLLSGLLLLAAGTSHAALIFSENFNGYYTSNFGTQADTGLLLGADGSLPGWNGAGQGIVHAVDLGGSNWAPMFYRNNVITLATPITANSSGTLYDVAFDAGSAVYGGTSQATTALDGLVVKVLRGDNSVLSQYTYQPGAWAGFETLLPTSFQYTGDGSGDVRLSVESLLNTETRFGGAIDNITIEAVPEPGTALFGIACVGIAAFRRRRSSAV